MDISRYASYCWNVKGIMRYVCSISFYVLGLIAIITAAAWLLRKKVKGEN